MPAPRPVPIPDPTPPPDPGPVPRRSVRPLPPPVPGSRGRRLDLGRLDLGLGDLDLGMGSGAFTTCGGGITGCGLGWTTGGGTTGGVTTGLGCGGSDLDVSHRLANAARPTPSATAAAGWACSAGALSSLDDVPGVDRRRRHEERYEEQVQKGRQESRPAPIVPLSRHTGRGKRRRRRVGVGGGKGVRNPFG